MTRSPVILFQACGLMLLFTNIPGSPLLGNYRRARYMLACAYLFFVVFEIVEYLLQVAEPSVPGVASVQTVSLAVAVTQAFLFTFAILALVEVRFPGWRYILGETLPVLLFVAGVFAAYLCCPEESFRTVFYAFAGIYALQMIRYTLLFLAAYRRFRFRMDNYFSDMEAGRLHWLAFSFFAALAVGVMALLSALFMSDVLILSFTVVLDVFYTFFAIRFVDYAHQFHTIEHAMDSGDTEETVQPDVQSGAEMLQNEGEAFVLLEKRMEEWIAGKGFTEQGITVSILATRLCTNSKYLSVYINTRKRQTFREWINELRIGEAKNILLQCPEMTVNEIAHRCGCSNRSSFLRLFKKHAGVSTTEWKKRAFRVKN
jgi:AraC-like DNA-binding protein